jgi:hypothetical protein
MAEAERSLERMFGARTEIVGTAWVDPGQVMLVLKSGRPVKVVTAGHSYKRGWRLPLIGKLSGIPVSTATHVIEVVVENINTASMYHLPKVTVFFQLRLRRGAGDWLELIEYVSSEGLNFVERLAPQVETELDQAVRDRLGREAYEDLFRTNLTSHLPASGTLLGGMFELQGVLKATPVWNPSHESIVVGVEKTALDLAELNRRNLVAEAELRGELTRSAIELEGQQALARAGFDGELALATARALASDRPTDIFLNPDLNEAERAERLAYLTLIMENPHSSSIPGVQSLFHDLMGRRSGPTEQGARPNNAYYPGELSATFATPELRIDPALSEVFRSHNLLSFIAGLGWARRQDTSTVLCVTAHPDLVEPLRMKLEEGASDVTKGRATLYIARYQASLPALIESYLEQRLPALAASRARFETRLADDRLEIVLDETEVSGGDFRQTIRDPTEMILEPLKRVLPYKSVDIVPG